MESIFCGVVYTMESDSAVCLIPWSYTPRYADTMGTIYSAQSAVCCTSVHTMESILRSVKSQSHIKHEYNYKQTYAYVQVDTAALHF